MKKHKIDLDYQEPWEEYYSLPFHIESYENVNGTIRDTYQQKVFDIVEENLSEDEKTVIIMKINGSIGLITNDCKWDIKGGSIYRDGVECLRLNTIKTLADDYKLDWKEAKNCEQAILKYVVKELKRF